jgi:16S rRNA (guanine527-N7)-methyltransferase
MAAVLPDVEFALVEPLQKRARLLRELASAMGLANVTVHAVRAEEAGRGMLREQAGLVTARAVATLPELLEYTAPLARIGGTLALPKGSGLNVEVAAASNALAALGCGEPSVVPMRQEVSSTLSVLIVGKTASTPTAYPRRPGVPGRRPL